jgi:hypothetical protein
MDGDKMTTYRIYFKNGTTDRLLLGFIDATRHTLTEHNIHQFYLDNCVIAQFGSVVEVASGEMI